MSSLCIRESINILVLNMYKNGYFKSVHSDDNLAVCHYQTHSYALCQSLSCHLLACFVVSYLLSAHDSWVFCNIENGVHETY